MLLMIYYPTFQIAMTDILYCKQNEIIDCQKINQSISLSLQYLIKSCKKNGQFTYRINVNPNHQPKLKYNMLRHAGVLYALSQHYQSDHFNKKLSSIIRRSAIFLNQFIKKVDGNSDILALWSDPIVTKSKKPLQAKLGGSGLSLVALCQSKQIFPDLCTNERLKKLGNFIIFMQKSDGSFYSKYIPSDKGKSDKWQSLYYPGEAILGLLALYQHDGNRKWLQAAIDSFLFYSNPENKVSNPEPNHWMIISLARLFSLPDFNPDELLNHRLMNYAIDICKSILELHIQHDLNQKLNGSFSIDGRLTPTSTMLEGLISSLFFLPSRETDLHKKIKSAVHSGILLILNNQIKVGKYSGGIQRGIGQLHQSHPKYSQKFNRRVSEIRIDYVQHALNALFLYSNVFCQK